MNLDFEKGSGLVPAIVQHANTLQVLMLGYMNKEAFEKTRNSGTVVFFSRSRNTLWTKGETSGNFLRVKELIPDCDSDTLLIKAIPEGPTCHTGKESCFGDLNAQGFLYKLEALIRSRINEKDEESYTYRTYRDGINRMAQKVGEEAVELVIESKDDNALKFDDEAADLLYHLLILLRAKERQLVDIETVLKKRSES